MIIRRWEPEQEFRENHYPHTGLSGHQNSFIEETNKLNIFREQLLRIWWQHRYIELSGKEISGYSLENLKEALNDTRMNSLMRHTIEQYEKVRMMFENISHSKFPTDCCMTSSVRYTDPELLIILPRQSAGQSHENIPSYIEWDVAYREVPFSWLPQLYSGKSDLTNLADKYSVQDIFQRTDIRNFFRAITLDDTMGTIADWEISSFILVGFTENHLKRNMQLPVHPGDATVSRYSPMLLAQLLGFEDDDEDFLNATRKHWSFNPYITTGNEIPFVEIHEGFVGITGVKIYNSSDELIKYPVSPLHDIGKPIVVWAK